MKAKLVVGVLLLLLPSVTTVTGPSCWFGLWCMPGYPAGFLLWALGIAMFIPGVVWTYQLGRGVKKEAK